MEKHNCSDCAHQFIGPNQIKFCGAFPIYALTSLDQEDKEYYQCVTVRQGLWNGSPTCPAFKPPTRLQQLWAAVTAWVMKYMRGAF